MGLKRLFLKLTIGLGEVAVGVSTALNRTPVQERKAAIQAKRVEEAQALADAMVLTSTLNLEP